MATVPTVTDRDAARQAGASVQPQSAPASPTVLSDVPPCGIHRDDQADQADTPDEAAIVEHQRESGLLHQPLPPGVIVRVIEARGEQLETRIKLGGPNHTDEIVSNNFLNGDLIHFSLLGRRPDGCSATNWRGVARGAIKRMREAADRLEQIIAEGDLEQVVAAERRGTEP